MINDVFNWQKPKYCKAESHFCNWLIVITLTMVSIEVFIDLLSSIVIGTQMQGFLAVDDTKAMWMGKSFFFFATFAQLYGTHMAKAYGFKRVLFLSFFLFLIGSTCSGFTRNYFDMIFFRSITGIGGGLCLSISLGYIAVIIPEEMKKKALTAYSSTFFGLGITIGLLVGGYIGQTNHWRLAFTLTPFFAIPTLLLMLLIFPETEKIKMPPFDFLSFFSLKIFFFCLLLIVTQAKAPWNTMGWNSLFIKGCVIVALFSFLMFSIACFTVKNPLIDLHLFYHPRYTIGCLGMLIVGFMVFGITIAMESLLENIFMYERWTLALFLSTIGLTYFLVGLIPIFFSNIIKPRLFIFIGLTLIIASCFMNQQMTIQSDKFELGLYQTVHSIGIALVLGPFTVISLAVLKPEDLSKGSALISFLRFMAATFGSAIIGLIIEIRYPFHSLRYGEQVNIDSARYQQYFNELNQHVIENGGIASQTQGMIIKYINNQAMIASLNDAIYILGWATIGIMMIMFLLMSLRFWLSEEKKAELSFEVNVSH